MQRADELFRQGTDLLRQGRAAEAGAAYAAVLRLVPDHADARRLIGLAALQGGQADLAVARLARAAALSPGDADVLHLLGGALRRGGAGETAAIIAYTRAVVIRPFFPECRFNRGNALSQAGRLPEALDAYRGAVAQDPLHPTYRLNCAAMALRCGDGEASLAAARAGAALAPAHVGLLTALLRAAVQSAAAPTAERAAARLRRLEPKREGAALDHALTLVKIGKEAAALADFRKLARAADADIRRGARQGLYNLTVALSDRGEARAAAAAVALSDDSPDDGTAFSPTRVRLESSSACNLRCRHCTTGVDYTGSDRRIMRPELFERAVDELRRLDGLAGCVMYLGGEPLMNPKLATMIRRLRDLFPPLHIHFVTNAMLATEDRCRELATSGVDKVFISIDGRTPEENDTIRRGSHYPTVRDHIRLLRRHLEPAGVFLAISNNALRRAGDPDTPQPPAFLTADFPGMAIMAGYAYKWPGWRAEGAGDDADAPTPVATPARRAGFCGAPFHETVIRANGDVTMCCYDISGLHVMGNILEAPLTEIWNNPRYRAARQAMRAGDEAALPQVCRDCPVYTGEELHSMN
jgi:radical SAM protein with 4Fe4S-binding SPASM domain